MMIRTISVRRRSGACIRPSLSAAPLAYAMEVHLVHKNANGNLAVVGVFLKRGAPNATLQKVLDHVSGTLNEISAVKGVTVNASSLIPGNHQVFHYSGSLTTPPCRTCIGVPCWFPNKPSLLQKSRR